MAYGGIVPRFNSARLAKEFERLSSGPKLASIVATRSTPYQVHFKQSAYNWLVYCFEQPPSFDTLGKQSPQSQFADVSAISPAYRDLLMVVMNTRLAFVHWGIIGDDFHVTKHTAESFPFNVKALSSDARSRLIALAPLLQLEMEKNVQFKLNAGKQVGTYNLRRCRNVTDIADDILARELGLLDVWDDIELLYAQVVRTAEDEANDEPAA